MQILAATGLKGNLIPKELAQADLAATTLTDLYTCPASSNVEDGLVTLCNRSGSVVNVRVAVAIAGAANDNKQYKEYDIAVPGNDTFHVPGIRLAAADVLRVYASAATVSATFSGLLVA